MKKKIDITIIHASHRIDFYSRKKWPQWKKEKFSHYFPDLYSPEQLREEVIHNINPLFQLLDIGVDKEISEASSNLRKILVEVYKSGS